MKGLFIKDILTLKTNTIYLISMLVLAVLLSIESSMIFTYFFVGLLGSSFATSSFSYDQSERCLMYLLCLPTNRRQYVKEKYLFIITVTIGFMATILLISSLIQNTMIDINELYLLLAIVMMIMIYIAFVIPIKIAFPPEKAIIVHLTITAIMTIPLIASNGLYADLSQADAIKAIVDPMGLICISISAFICLFVSYLISAKIMANKNL